MHSQARAAANRAIAHSQTPNHAAGFTPKPPAVKLDRHFNRPDTSVQLGDEPKPGTWRQTTPTPAMDRATARSLQGAANMQLQNTHFSTTQRYKKASDMHFPAGRARGFGPPEDCPTMAKQEAHIGMLAQAQQGQVASIVGKTIYGPQEQPVEADRAGVRVNEGRTAAPPKPEMFDSSLTNVRLFIARVRRKGAQFARTVHEAFKNSLAQTPDGGMHYNEFRRLGFQLGLTHREHEAECIFECFSKGTPQLLYVDDLLTSLYPALPPNRLAVVQQAWQELDPDGDGVITVSDLLYVMNPQMHPEVIAGRRSKEACRRELLEYFGASNVVIFPSSEFTMEETAAGRRRPQIGSLRTPLKTPAGLQGESIGGIKRSVGDVKDEISVHPPNEHLHVEIYAEDFFGYYTSVSLLVPDDDDFEGELRAMWRVTGPGGLAPDASHHGFVVDFEDGSRGLMKLRNDKGLDASSLAGAAGFSSGNFAGMGPEVSIEVKKRLETQCGRKIVKFSWA